MSGVTKKKYIKKTKVVPREKSRILDEYCSPEQVEILVKLIKQGSVFILLGSEHSYTGEFYKGLMQLMYTPTFNGAACYDAHYQFKHAYERPMITISLNDGCNKNKVDSIKKLDRYRSTTLYSYHYADGGDV